VKSEVRPASRWRIGLLVLAVVVVSSGPLLAACGDTRPSGSTNVQGGAVRAPQPGSQATPRATNTPAR
jgi:hypothetical protein